MSVLKVYKASAGSGKTYRLALEYIKLLIRRPDAYQNILAVTFTNKAAGEMKTRVLDELSVLADKEKALRQKGSLLEKICGELRVYDAGSGKMRPVTQEEVIRNANRALGLILHDYSHFQIETIDSFFQRILRNLARELGIGSSLNIELDTNAVVEEAVDQLIEKAHQHPETLDWMEAYMREQMEDGKSHHIGNELKKFGKSIYMEKFQQHRHKIAAALQDKEFLKKYRQELIRLEKEIEKTLTGYADEFFKTLENNGFDIDDLKNGKSGVAGFFINLRKGEFTKRPGKRAGNARTDIEEWSKNPDVKKLAENSLQTLLNKTCEYQEKNIRLLNSVRLSLKHLFKIGLLNSISQTANDINQEENRFILSNTAYLLDCMVGDSDTSFIFEKIGTHLKHIMIDEFQDTSHLQWNIFKHLLKECLATQWQDSLIVGDVKQSIYRFRNGDWSILNNMEKALPANDVDIIQMEENWRSRKNIVEFNNTLFEKAPAKILEAYGDILNKDLSEQIDKAYRDVAQLCRKNDGEGMVSISLFEAENYEKEMMEALLETLSQLQAPHDPQPKVRDICILTRKGKEMQSIASRLNAEGYKVISDEAFELGSSALLRCIIAAMRLVLCPEDVIALEALRNFRPRLYQDFTLQTARLTQLPLTEMVYTIYRLLQLDAEDPHQDFREESDYLFAFMDFLNDYLSRNHSDLADFLQYWDEKLSTSSLPSNRQRKGIRMMTIHKAKGLDAHTVIVPFCHWPLIESTGFKASTVWSEPREAPFNQMQLLPVNYSNNMAESIFEKEYREESQQMLMDSLNLLYVAFTRAKCNLIVYAPKRKDETRTSGVGDLLQACLPFDKEDKYQTGELMEEKEEDKGQQERLKEIYFINEPKQARFRQSNRAKDFIRESIVSAKEEDSDGVPDKENDNIPNGKPDNTSKKDDTRHPYIERGKLLHYLFELIRHKEDSEEAVQSLTNEGLLAREEKDEYLALVREALSQEGIQDWYSGDYELYNECSILFKDKDGHLQERRPDRVVMKDGKVTVIDFKFGKPRKSHLNQVKEYVSLLHEMGFEKVEGYIWYVEQADIVNVDGL